MNMNTDEYLATVEAFVTAMGINYEEVVSFHVTTDEATFEVVNYDKEGKRRKGSTSTLTVKANWGRQTVAPIETLTYRYHG